LSGCYRNRCPDASEWAVIGEPTFADAILDRLVHNAYRLELDGPSMRKLRHKKKEQAA